MDRRTFLAASAIAPLAARPAAAAAYPERPIRWLVPYPAGGGSDVIARTLAEGVSVSTGQPVIVDNRPGASTNIAAGALLQSRPDGYTLMQADNAAMCWNEFLFQKLPYNPRRDFTYIGAIGRFPVALVVHPSFPAANLAEFMSRVQAAPGRHSYASPGVGSPHHLAMELLKQRARLDLLHVPYKGGAPALQDVLSGQVPAMMLDLASGLPHMASGRVRPLAIALPARAKSLAQVPTFLELGVTGVEAFAYQGLLGPAGMPPDVVQRLNAELNAALARPAAAKLFGDTGAEPTPLTPAEFERTVAAERERWAPVIRTAAIRLE